MEVWIGPVSFSRLFSRLYCSGFATRHGPQQIRTHSVAIEGQEETDEAMDGEEAAAAVVVVVTEVLVMSRHLRTLPTISQPHRRPHRDNKAAGGLLGSVQVS